MWGRKRIRGPKIIIALIDFNQTVFRLGDAETETVIFNDFLDFKSKIVFVLSENFGWDGRTDGRTKVVKSCNKGEEKQSGEERTVATFSSPILRIQLNSTNATDRAQAAQNQLNYKHKTSTKKLKKMMQHEGQGREKSENPARRRGLRQHGK
jgi:hypothetical protein